MSEPFERLVKARLAAGFQYATDAANAMGVKIPTYIHHENGTAGLSRAGARYARFYKVSLEWLLTGRGEMKPRGAMAAGIPLDGVVGAGATVEMIDDPAGDTEFDQITLPDDGTLGALVVRGESQWPVFTDGEIILYDRRPVLPDTLIGHMAIVQATDGRRLIKTLRRGKTDRLWRLESHNAPPEDDVLLIGAWRYVGSLERR